MVSDLSNDQPGDFATALAEEASIDRPDVSFDDLKGVLERFGLRGTDGADALAVVIADTPARASLHALRGLALLDGRPSDALEDFDAAIAIDPTVLLYGTLRAVALAVTGAREETIAYVAKQRGDDLGPAVAELGMILSQTGHASEALDLFEDADQLATDRVLYANSRAFAFLVLDRLEEAVAVAQSIPDGVVVPALLGALATRLSDAGRTSEAADHYLREARLEGGTFNWGLLPEYLRRAGRLDKAVAIAGEVPSEQTAYYENLLADALQSDGRRDEAASYYLSAVERQPLHDYFYANLVEAFRDLDRLSEIDQVAARLEEPARSQLIYARDADRALRSGDTLRDQGKFAAALASYCSPLRPAEVGIGDFRTILGRIQLYGAELVEAIDEALTQSPRASALRALRGMVLLEGSDVPNALLDLRAVVEAAPGAPFYVQMRDAALILAGRRDEVVARLGDLSDRDRAAALNDIGIILGESHPETALALFDDAQNLESENSEYANNRVRALFLLDRLDEAMSAANAIPDQLIKVSRIAALAERLESAGRAADAADQYLRAAKLDPRTFYWPELPEVLGRAGRLDEAIELSSAVGDEQIAYYENRLGDALKEAERWEEAATYYRQAAERRPPESYFYTDLVTVLEHLGRVEEAVDFRDEVPIESRTYFDNRIGDALKAEGHWERAVTYYRQAIEGQPAEEYFYVDLVNALANVERLDDAIALAPTLDEPFRTFVWGAIRETAVAWVAEDERLDAAVEVLQKLVSEEHEDARAWYVLGFALAAQKNSADAERAYRNATRLDPESAVYLGAYSWLLVDMKRVPEAEEPARRAFALSPEDDSVVSLLAAILWELEKHADIVQVYRRVLEVDSRNVDARIILGELLYEDGDWVGAEGTFRGALAEQPEKFGLHGNVGMTLVQQGRFDEAIEEFTEAVDKSEGDQQDVRDHINLAWLLQRQGDLPQSERRLREALDRFPDSCEVRLKLAVTLSATDRHDLAYAVLQEAVPLEAKHDESPAMLQYALGFELVHLNKERTTRERQVAQLEEAAASFGRAAKLGLPHGHAELNLGEINVFLERWPLAESSFTRAAKSDNPHVQARALEGLTRVYLEMGDLYDARDFYQDAVQNAHAAFDAMKKEERAIDEQRKATLYFSRGLAQSKLGLVAAARSDFRSCCTEVPPDTPLWLAADRNLRRLREDATVTPPRWLPHVLLGLAAAIVVGSFLLAAFNSLSSSALPIIITVAVAMVVIGYYLPVLTRLKMGAVELERNVPGADTRPLTLTRMPDEGEPLGTGWDPLSSFGSLTYWNDPYVSEPETGAEADDAKRSSTASDDLIGPTPPTEAPTAA